MAGKGSFQRPTNRKRYGDNYDLIFKKPTTDQTPADQQPDQVEHIHPDYHQVMKGVTSTSDPLLNSNQ